MWSRNFERLNTFMGWGVGMLALLVYGLTVEPTVSFWDAGEYIATSAKLQVAHPPGAPLLQMIGSFFALFASEPETVAKWVNYVSVVTSALTISLLFWTVTRLLKKMIGQKRMVKEQNTMIILGSGLIGATTFLFSDSFWFNATETEVYSTASLVMALLLWLGLRWADSIDQPRGNKWLVLISFVVGLTFGVQFMGFLAIPSVGLLYYFERYKKVTVKGFLIANLAVVAILLLVFKFSLTYVLKLFGWGEVFLVNNFGFPYNFGSAFMGLLVALAFYLGLRYSIRKKYRNIHTVLLSLLFLILGFSSWLMLPIRASAGVVINENNPADARLLLAYYNREQYPSTDSPFYGAYYSDMFAPAGEPRDDSPKYERDEATGRYMVVNHTKDAFQGPNKKHMGWLPRMWSSQNAENYMQYYGPLEFTVRREYRSNSDLNEAVRKIRQDLTEKRIDITSYIDWLKKMRNYVEVTPPGFWDNLRYMMHYQFGYMYVRYFMWNFVGRQNDVQGRFDGNGEWLSGIGFLDRLRLGSQEHLPQEVLKNKGRNTYFFLPLLLGIVGLVCQIKKDPKRFWVLLVFFLFTGLAIQFYTNPPIFQPRERDYSLVGSFYIFAIWIGIGVYGIFDAFQKWVRPKILACSTLLICLVVPVLMAQQNWDDHDRSNRFTALAMAKMYLDSTEKDAGAILFTIGDNDTFPLWYAQDIEGYRTDTRIVCTTYFGADWYIDQMKRKAYQSEPIPSQLSHAEYRYGTRDYLYYYPLTEQSWDIKDFMKWVASDRPETKVRNLLEKNNTDVSGYPQNYLNAVYYPTNKIRVPVNKEKVLERGLVKTADAHLIVDYIDIDLPETGISKTNLLMLDIIANNHWERPIYFSGGSFDDPEYIWMSDFLQLDGLVYKLVPIRTTNETVFEKGRIDSDKAYDIVTQWNWGNSGSPEIYHDPQTRRQWGVNNRTVLARLLEQLLEENRLKKAKVILTLATENIPVDYYDYYTFVEPFLDGYFKVGDTKNARTLFKKLQKVYEERLRYHINCSLEQQYENIAEIIGDLQGYQRLIDILLQNKDTEWAEKEASRFNRFLESLQTVLDRG